MSFLLFNSTLSLSSNRFALAFALCLLANPCLAITSTDTKLSVTPVAALRPDVVVTLTATVTGGGKPLTRGTVSFCDGSAAASCPASTLLGEAALTAAGTAMFRTRLSAGPHTIRAIFNGTASFAKSSSTPTMLTSTGLASTRTTLTSAGATNGYTLEANVSAFGSKAPSGNVSFYDTNHGNASLGSSPLHSAGAVLAYDTTTLNTPYGYATAIGDFNNDGIPDLAASGVDAELTIWLGKGDGTFTALQPTNTVGYTPLFIVVADFNDDGSLDLATENLNDQTISILLGKGDGTFTLKTTITAQAGLIITLGDFNRDGFPDIGLDNQVLIGNGDGTFVSKPTPLRGDITTGDFNGDGKLDIASADYGTVDIALGNGDGTFGSPTMMNIDGEPSDIISGDFNRDGILDLAVGFWSSTSNNAIAIFLGTGDGSFKQPTTVALSDDQRGDHPFLQEADLNGDGILDLLADTQILFGAGDGTFKAQQSLPPSLYPTIASIGDLNADGVPDLVLGTQMGKLSVLLGHKDVATQMTVPIGVRGTHYIEARYSGDGSYSSSSSPNLTLNVNATANPILSPAPGVYGSTTNVTITDQTAGAVIHYTLDGTPPTSTSPVYSSPIPVTWDTSISAIAYAAASGESAIITGSYTVDRPLPAVTFSLPGGRYSAPQSLTLTDYPSYCAHAVCEIHYTLDGTTPSKASKRYTNPIVLSTAGTTIIVKAIALSHHFTQSPVASATYTLNKQ